MPKDTPRTLKVGLTGGVASGKSAVSAMFAELGVPVIDTDQLARELVEPGQPALIEIERRFGTAVIGTDGRLVRDELRRAAFNDPTARRDLEMILHPPIRARLGKTLSAIDGPYALAVVPLLIETDFATLVDRIVVVDCPIETQVQRLMARDNIDETLAQRMLEAQTDREARLAAAHDVINNSGSPAATREQVQRLHKHYLSLRTDVCRAGAGRAK